MQQPRKENQYRAPQKPRTAQNSNPENTSKPSKKEKKPRPSTQKTLTDPENTNPLPIIHRSYVQIILIDLNNGICMDYIYYSYKEPKGQIICQKYEVFNILL